MAKRLVEVEASSLSQMIRSWIRVSYEALPDEQKVELVKQPNPAPSHVVRTPANTPSNPERLVGRWDRFLGKWI
jgi:hypothetical protein